MSAKRGPVSVNASQRPPRVSIGLPVYNGERYLAAALDSLLAQTFADFELIVSDNGSSDATDEICTHYAALDRRIRYIRHATNLGAIRNHNLTIELSSGEFFKWAAHDDVYAPKFIERCVEALDQHPEAVLAFSRTEFIDEDGKSLGEFSHPLDLAHPSRGVRFLNYVCAQHIMVEDYGLIRSDVLKRTRLLENYVWSDMVLFGELALHGPFLQVPDILFHRRDHPERAMRANRQAGALSVWNDPRGSGGSMLPTWRVLRGHLESLMRAPLSSSERISLGIGAVRRGLWTHRLGPEIRDWTRSNIWRSSSIVGRRQP